MFKRVLISFALAISIPLIGSAQLFLAFETELDTTVLGGQTNEKIVLSLQIDSGNADADMDPERGLFFSSVSGEISVGSEVLELTDGFTDISNRSAGSVEDSFRIVFSGASRIRGDINGNPITNVDLRLFDEDKTMFGSDSIPSELSFTQEVDYFWLYIWSGNSPRLTYRGDADYEDGTIQFLLTDLSIIPEPAFIGLLNLGVLGVFLILGNRRKTL